MLARTDGPSVPATTISTACSRLPVSLACQPASSMNRVQKSDPGSSALSRDSETCTPRIRARWSARSRWRPSSVSDVAARLSTAVLEIVVGDDPRVPAAPALRAVDHERPGLQGDAGQPARRDVLVRACEHERPEVLVAAAKAAAVEHRLDGKRDDRLGDEGARHGGDAAGKLLALLLGGSWADEHPVATRRVDGLDHQRGEMLE